MDHPLLSFFTSNVLNAYTTGDRTKSSKKRPIQADHDFTDFGLTDHLLDLITRIATLHSLPRLDTGLTPATTISSALGIWHDLHNWRPPKTVPSHAYNALYSAYTSALFIWLYLIIHPDNVTDEKVQQMVKSGIGDLRGLIGGSGSVGGEVVVFCMIPGFIYGLAAVEKGDRDVVEAVFGRVERVCRQGEVKRYRDVVKQSWRAYARGVKRSWDVGYA